MSVLFSEVLVLSVGIPSNPSTPTFSVYSRIYTRVVLVAASERRQPKPVNLNAATARSDIRSYFRLKKKEPFRIKQNSVYEYLQNR